MASIYANLLEQKKAFTWEKSSTPRGFSEYTNMAAVSLSWNTNNLLLITKLIIKTYLQVISFHKLLFISIKKNSFQLKNSFHNSKNKNSFKNKILFTINSLEKKEKKKKLFIQNTFYNTDTTIGTPIWPPWRHVKTLYILSGSKASPQ